MLYTRHVASLGILKEKQILSLENFAIHHVPYASYRESYAYVPSTVLAYSPLPHVDLTHNALVDMLTTNTCLFLGSAALHLVSQ